MMVGLWMFTHVIIGALFLTLEGTGSLLGGIIVAFAYGAARWHVWNKYRRNTLLQKPITAEQLLHTKDSDSRSVTAIKNFLLYLFSGRLSVKVTLAGCAAGLLALLAGLATLGSYQDATTAEKALSDKDAEGRKAWASGRQHALQQGTSYERAMYSGDYHPPEASDSFFEEEKIKTLRSQYDTAFNFARYSFFACIILLGLGQSIRTVENKAAEKQQEKTAQVPSDSNDRVT